MIWYFHSQKVESEYINDKLLTENINQKINSIFYIGHFPKTDIRLLNDTFYMCRHESIISGIKLKGTTLKCFSYYANELMNSNNFLLSLPLSDQAIIVNKMIELLQNIDHAVNNIPNIKHKQKILVLIFTSIFVSIYIYKKHRNTSKSYIEHSILG